MSKKTFKSNLEKIENPALQFISTVPNKEQTERFSPVPEGYKVVPEAKSKRLQLLIQPSLYDRIKERAEASVNDTIHSILSKAMRGE